MITLLLLLVTAWSRVELVNQEFEIPAKDRWAVGDPLNQGGWICGDYRCGNPDCRIRLVLLERREWHAWLAGQDHEEIASTPFATRGTLRHFATEPDIFLVLDNAAAHRATVYLRVILEKPQVTYLSNTRKLAVILISFAVFFGIVGLSARKLLTAIRR
jgi:hypothetical protein